MSADNVFRALQRQLESWARPLRQQVATVQTPCDWCEGHARDAFEQGRREGAADASHEIYLALNQTETER